MKYPKDVDKEIKQKFLEDVKGEKDVYKGKCWHKREKNIYIKGGKDLNLNGKLLAKMKKRFIWN